ncbi:hypothetical protein Vretimale_11256, partial [Volvox reticuliferus]
DDQNPISTSILKNPVQRKAVGHTSAQPNSPPPPTRPPKHTHTHNTTTTTTTTINQSRYRHKQHRVATTHHQISPSLCPYLLMIAGQHHLPKVVLRIIRKRQSLRGA